MSYSKIKIFVFALLLVSMPSKSYALDSDEVLGFVNVIQTVIGTSQGLSQGSVCILGSDEISASLSSQLKLINLNDEYEKFTSCKVIYIASDKAKSLKLEVAKFNRRRIMTIGIFEGFVESGGMIQVQIGRRNFELTINSKLIKDSGIRLGPLATEMVVN